MTNYYRRLARYYGTTPDNIKTMLSGNHDETNIPIVPTSRNARDYRSRPNSTSPRAARRTIPIYDIYEERMNQTANLIQDRPRVNNDISSSQSNNDRNREAQMHLIGIVIICIIITMLISALL